MVFQNVLLVTMSFAVLLVLLVIDSKYGRTKLPSSLLTGTLIFTFTCYLQNYLILREVKIVHEDIRSLMVQSIIFLPASPEQDLIVDEEADKIYEELERVVNNVEKARREFENDETSHVQF